MAFTHTEVRGFSPMGSSVCFQRRPRKTIARMPKGKESTIYVQSMRCMSTSEMLEKSKSRYIQYSIAPPRINGSAIFSIFRAIFLVSIFRYEFAKVMEIREKTKYFPIFYFLPNVPGIEFRPSCFCWQIIFLLLSQRVGKLIERLLKPLVLRLR